MKLYDLHTHSIFSDGDATLDFLVEKAQQKGYILGVSDHIYCGQIDTKEQITQYLNALDQYDVFKGVEANIGTDFDIPDHLRTRLDYCIASLHALPNREGQIVSLTEYFGWRAGHRPHYQLNYKSSDAPFFLEKNLRLIEDSFSRFPVDILGHATVTPFYDDMEGTQLQSDFEDELLSLCKKYGVALEISGLWKQPSCRVIMKGKEKGIRFSFGSDCHRLSEVCDLSYVQRMIEETGLRQEEIFIPKKR